MPINESPPAIQKYSDLPTRENLSPIPHHGRGGAASFAVRDALKKMRLSSFVKPPKWEGDWCFLLEVV